MHAAFLWQQGGDPSLSNAYMNSRGKYTPYTIPTRHQRINLHKHDQMYANTEEGPKPAERQMEGNKQHETPQNWFKITIPFGIRYEEKWLLNLIQSKCSISFNPVEFHYDKMQAHFFVENADIAFELKSISDKIWDENCDKISIFISPCDIPRSVKELKSEKIDQTKLDAFQPSDSLHLLPEDLMTHTTDMAPIPRSCMTLSLNIHETNMTQLLPLNQSHKKPYRLLGLSDTMPMSSNTEIQDVYKNEVKSAEAMVKEKNLNPGEVHEDRSSLCTTTLDKSNNINSILELFPKLLSLDDQGSPRSTACNPEASKNLPTCKGSFFGSEIVKALVLEFLQQYYWIYDHGDRQGLLSAYHAKAYFSLSILFTSLDSSPSSLCEYLKYSRNMKTLKDPYMRRYLLKHKKCDIIFSLCALPKTQHDLTSFVVDICFQTERMVCFSVNGMFMEVEGRFQGCIRAFTRTFIATIGSSSNLCIINDKLFVRNVQELPSAIIPMATPSSSYLPDLSQEQQETVQAFYPQSGMNLQWSQKVLHDSHWNYQRPIQSLTLPRAQDPIQEKLLTLKDLES
ncbi:nuclear RNA export factor 3 [Nannospalax galili]|uniref:nuclear RNA export factor 3 n=1 Tax=Nannospalax galili TaxID=1026970 RepID=UPI00111BDE3C|nr:nuclear RNA export factor 3 [Nannospalax galili]